MNKTALLIGAMIVFAVVNVVVLTFVLNRSQQPVGQQLALKDAGTAEPAAGEAGGGATASVDAAGAADPVAFQSAMDIGKTEFVTCAACHGPDGKGLQVGAQLMAPSLVGSQIALGDPDQAALVVLKGIKKETTDYVGLMAPLPLDDNKLAGVLTYVRNSFGNQGSLVTSQEVAAARARFASVPDLVSRTGLDSLLAANPKVAAPSTAPGAAIPAVAATSLPPQSTEPWVPIPGIRVVGGRLPDQRPDGAPLLTSTSKDGDWYNQATRGITGSYPDSLQFLEDQGEWYTPFSRPGMTGPYDIRNWHIDE